MAEQLTFDLPARLAQGWADFCVSPANRNAVGALAGWRDWPGGKLALIGPEGAGKSHLVRVWLGEAAAHLVVPGTGADLPPGACVAVEDADRLAGDPVAEEALFHLHERVLGQGGRLLVTGREAPARWPVALADLASRLGGMALARIAPPDDELLARVLAKHFADRQLRVAPSVITWLVPRMPRTFAAALALVQRIDSLALVEARPVTPALARRALDSLDSLGGAGA